MPISLANPALSREFFLVNSDQYFEVPETTRIVVRAVDVSGEVIRRELLRSDVWFEINDGMRIADNLTMDEIHAYEVMVTLVECNIVDRDAPLFRFENDKISMTEEEFFSAWMRLPIQYAKEIIECVHELNPKWVLKEGEDGR